MERPDALFAGVGLEVSHHHLFDEQSRTCSGSPLRRARPVRHNLVLRFHPHSPSQLTKFSFFFFFGWFHEKWNFEKGLKIMGQKEREREKYREGGFGGKLKSIYFQRRNLWAEFWVPSGLFGSCLTSPGNELLFINNSACLIYFFIYIYIYFFFFEKNIYIYIYIENALI